MSKGGQGRGMGRFGSSAGSMPAGAVLPAYAQQGGMFQNPEPSGNPVLDNAMAYGTQRIQQMPRFRSGVPGQFGASGSGAWPVGPDGNLLQWNPPPPPGNVPNLRDPSTWPTGTPRPGDPGWGGTARMQMPQQGLANMAMGASFNPNFGRSAVPQSPMYDVGGGASSFVPPTQQQAPQAVGSPASVFGKAAPMPYQEAPPMTGGGMPKSEAIALPSMPYQQDQPIASPASAFQGAPPVDSGMFAQSTPQTFSTPAALNNAFVGSMLYANPYGYSQQQLGPSFNPVGSPQGGYFQGNRYVPNVGNARNGLDDAARWGFNWDGKPLGPKVGA